MRSNFTSIMLPAILAVDSAEVERQMLQIVWDVKGELCIPVAVKLSPLFTAFANFALQVDAGGADGLVLFTRFHKVDFDVLELEVIRRVELSSSSDLDLRLRGAAVLADALKHHRNHWRNSYCA